MNGFLELPWRFEDLAFSQVFEASFRQFKNCPVTLALLRWNVNKVLPFSFHFDGPSWQDCQKLSLNGIAFKRADRT